MDNERERERERERLVFVKNHKRIQNSLLNTFSVADMKCLSNRLKYGAKTFYNETVTVIQFLSGEKN